MSIKNCLYIFETICQIKNIDFLAIDGFTFNQNSPIKALGKKYFINDNGLVKVDFCKMFVKSKILNYQKCRKY